MNKIAIDIVGPLAKTADGNTHILTTYDPFSHWPSAYAISSTDAETVIRCLKRHMAIHSIPTTALSDRGKNFMAKSVLDFLADLGA